MSLICADAFELMRSPKYVWQRNACEYLASKERALLCVPAAAISNRTDESAQLWAELTGATVVIANQGSVFPSVCYRAGTAPLKDSTPENVIRFMVIAA